MTIRLRVAGPLLARASTFTADLPVAILDPNATLTEVAAWLEVNLRSATRPEETGKKRVKDERDFTDSNRVHASLASRGESIYTGVKGELTLAVEAVTPDECRTSHDGADVAPLKSGRRR